jgi:3-oxoacyl-[acyl-carrier-protein] synthase-3
MRGLSRLSSKDDEGVHEKIIGEILALIKKQGKVSPKDLNALLESLGNERGGETSEDIYKAAHQLFGMGVLRVVPESIRRLLDRTHKSMKDVDLFVFHQANEYMLEHLRRKVGIPKERFQFALRYCGNTVSATIPIALRLARDEGKLAPGKLVMLAGFGVGYSWGSTFIRWCGD